MRAAKEKYGFGIVGCGVISDWHIRSVLETEGAYLVGVADKNVESAKKKADEYSCRCFDNADELISSDEVDVVCICTPSGLHAPLAIKCANAGKHFVVEKPMAITKEQCDGIIKACEENGVKGCVISQFRFSSAVKALKKAIEEGLLGQIVAADLSMNYYRSPEYYKSSAWRGTWEMDGGGALMNQGIHGIDVLTYLMGNVKTVCGVCKTLVHDIEVEDVACATVEYENGAVGTIKGTTSVLPGYPRRIEINGSRGSIAIVEDVITRWDVEGEIPREYENKSSRVSSYNNPSDFPIDYHKMQIKDMIDAIRNNRKPGIDVFEGRKAVDVILAVYESSKTGNKVVLDK